MEVPSAINKTNNPIHPLDFGSFVFESVSEGIPALIVLT